VINKYVVYRTDFNNAVAIINTIINRKDSLSYIMTEDTTLNRSFFKHYQAQLAKGEMMTDFTQVVSAALGEKSRKKRQDEKIREDLIRDYIREETSNSPSFKRKILDLFGRT
jgi:hypothetical protein